MILIYVHGFMGSKESFGKLPALIQRELPSTTIGHFEYDTEGNNEESVKLLAEHLNKQTDDMILLCHSMGGPLVIDASKLYRPTGSSKIKLILAFDSPFFGLSPTVTSHGFQKANEHVEKVTSVLSSLWGSNESVAKSNESIAKSPTEPTRKSSGWLAIGAAAIIAGAAAYSHPTVKENVDRHASKAFDKMKFLTPLLKVTDMSGRFEYIQSTDIPFHGCFLELPDESRFCNPCPAKYDHLFSVHKMTGKDVIDAHMGFFTDKDPEALLRLTVSTVNRINKVL
ncbi:hypothetical protein HDV04_004706 [Boothiomyces sp. JEL0838]|nr:hypothetical protein HDV04_004706 [Boothiomyces sp. JEL0838]